MKGVASCELGHTFSIYMFGRPGPIPLRVVLMIGHYVF